MRGKTADAHNRAAPEALSKQRLRLWLRLLRTTKQVEAELRDFLREEFDTTLPRFDVMAALYREEKGLKMSELSRRLLVSNGNVTGIVERLVNDGLVVRIPLDEDRRAMRVRLTTKGKQDFRHMAARNEEVLDGLFSTLDADALDSLIMEFTKLKTLRKARP